MSADFKLKKPLVAPKADIRQRLGVVSDGGGLMELAALVAEYLAAKDAYDAFSDTDTGGEVHRREDALSRWAQAEDALRAVIA